MSKIDNSVKITGIIVVGIIVIVLIAFYAFSELAVAEETVQATGISELTVMPDLVSIYFNVETNASTAKEAKDLNAEVVDRVTEALIGQGFDRSEIETMNFDVYEDIEWTYDGYSSKQVSHGYKATHTIRVKFSTEDQDKIGNAIDAGVDNGALLSYINFELSQDLENEYKAQALKEATQDARIKAEAMAEGLNTKLGGIVSVSNYDFAYSPWIAYDNRAYGAAEEMDSVKVASSVQPRNQQVGAQVSVVFEID